MFVMGGSGAERLQSYTHKHTHTHSLSLTLSHTHTHTHARRKAVSLLKRNRYRTKLLDNTVGQLDQLEQLVDNLEFAVVESKVFAGLKAGNDALAILQQV